MTGNLVEAFFLKTGKSVDKWEQYLAIYAREFARFAARGEPVALLEVGVQNGGSLELWAQVLPPGSTVIGLDIDQKVGDLTFDTIQIRAFVADATRAETIDPILGAQAFDIIIDDGSHRSSDIVAAFQILFPRLRPGGLYIIEDLHCSYYPSHEGGLRRPDASIEWLKGLIDAVNADHIDPNATDLEERRRLTQANQAIAGIAFYDSVAVIEKHRSEKNRPYRRLLSGERVDVERYEPFFDVVPRDYLDAMLFGHAAARRLDAELLRAIEAARSRAFSLEEQLVQARRELTDRAAEAAAAQQALAELRAAVTAQEATRREELERYIRMTGATHQ